MTSDTGTLHVLHSLRAEGCPRLAFDLIRLERQLTGMDCHVTIMDEGYPDLLPLYQEHHIPVSCLHWHRHGYVTIYRNTLKLLRRIKPLNVLCYTLGTHIAVAAAAARFGIPCVLHVGTAPPVQTPKVVHIMQAQMWAGLPFVYRYVGCSDYVRDQLTRVYRIPRGWCVSIPNGIDLSRYNAVRSSRRSQPARHEKVIGMVASLEQSKDHETLLQAMAILHQKSGQPWRLRLVGGGSHTAVLKNRARELGIEPWVDWVGPTNDVPAELLKMDLFTYSAKPEEGLGIALVEALASGLPVVASDVNACREVLRDYPNAVLVPYQNAARMAEGIRQALGQAVCSMDLLQRFSIESTARSYLQLVKRLPSR